MRFAFLALCAFELVMLALTIAGSFWVSDVVTAAFHHTTHTIQQAAAP